MVLATASRQERPPHTPSLFQYSCHCTACSSCSLLSPSLVSSLRARLHGSNRCPLPGAILAGAALLATPATVQNRCNWGPCWHRCNLQRYSMNHAKLLPAARRIQMAESCCSNAVSATVWCSMWPIQAAPLRHAPCSKSFFIFFQNINQTATLTINACCFTHSLQPGSSL